MMELLILGFAVFAVSTWSHLHALKKHDSVLFRFCQIRRDLMTLLRSEGLELSRADYVFARHILESLNHTIHNYKDHKARFFNFREFSRFLRQYSASAKELEALPRTANEALGRIERQTVAAVVEGFLCYTPFLRSETRIRFVLLLLSSLARLKFARIAQRAVRLKARIEEAVQQSSTPIGMQGAG